MLQNVSVQHAKVYAYTIGNQLLHCQFSDKALYYENGNCCNYLGTCTTISASIQHWCFISKNWVFGCDSS